MIKMKNDIFRTYKFYSIDSLTAVCKMQLIIKYQRNYFMHTKCILWMYEKPWNV